MQAERSFMPPISYATRIFAPRAQFKVLLGIGLTWACTYIFFTGLTEATLEGEPYAFPVFGGANFLILISAPVAQSVFFVLAQKTSWLLNLYLAISIACCAVAGLHVADGGYQFTYWHQGDLLCRHGCDDVWIFGWLVFGQACILAVSSPFVFEDFPGIWKAITRLFLIIVLSLLSLTSCALTMSF
ncbi:hypothetical protein UP09_31625 [Bradyrhizobium sp. LTSP885]|uniref:hypothetical protein n=1 Tax=Bradyrhizobium sp. LTSP885 TaxID=1619232 RepID=UPI0005DB1D88|nr:hypothetical protein [Bradyrhizobium sp. LTSP885]KJC35756.1 hypothetical protein UP09_31625 [Bradyrhizobium sp. LTSP885]